MACYLLVHEIHPRNAQDAWDTFQVAAAFHATDYFETRLSSVLFSQAATRGTAAAGPSGRSTRLPHNRHAYVDGDLFARSVGHRRREASGQRMKVPQ